MMINNADLLVNNEVKVTAPHSRWHGKTVLVRKVMADGSTLEVELAHEHGKIAFIDVGLVSEIQEPYSWPKQEQSLGPIANSVVKSTL